MSKICLTSTKNTEKYIESRKEQTWIHPDHLPSINKVTKYVKTTENPISKVIVRKLHYFMALLVIQNKKTILEPSMLEICEFIYQQDITASDTSKKSTSNVEDKGCESDDRGGKPRVLSSPVQK